MQLVGKKKPTKILGVSSGEQGGLGKGDDTSENVLEPIQVSIVLLRPLLACACEEL